MKRPKLEETKLVKQEDQVDECVIIIDKMYNETYNKYMQVHILLLDS
jgi:hypothetical protein